MIDDLPMNPSSIIPAVDGADPTSALYETDLLKWIYAAVVDGEAILKADPSYDDIEKSIAYIMGDQIDSKRPTELSSISINKLKDIVLQTVSALTDMHPLFGFKTFNTKFQAQGETLDKLARVWWVNSFSDLRLADVIRFSSVCGTGYCEVGWNGSLGGGAGDIELIARDPRDILPIRPTMDPSAQTWEGVIIRTSKSLNELRARFPEKADRLKPDRHPFSLAERMWRKFKGVGNRFASPAVDHLTAAPKSAVPRVPSIDLYHVYTKDRRIFKGFEAVIMGDPETNWSYTVYPLGATKADGSIATEEDARLFPRGRLIICTRSVILYDGPNPYWHGMFPIIKLCMDPWPWSMLGVGLARDLMPIQDAVNEVSNGIMDNIRKVLRPGVIGDKKSVPESQWQRLDTRVPGMKLKTNSTMGAGIELTKTDPLPVYVFDFLKLMVATMDQMSGVANLQALTQLNQAPGADSIEKMQEAMTPILRLRGRLLEAFLRELGEMVKCNFFQFYNMPRRVAMLGDEGVNFQDFDFDPGTLVPAMTEHEPDYDPQYDALKVPRGDRAKRHMKNFTFQITPNSLLAISQLSRKLMYLQLWRGGIIDPWTLFEILEIPNGGEPPNGAKTITERLLAMQMIGLQGQVNPAGQKASGQQAPSIQVKSDSSGLPRTTVSESGSGGG
jgi:hypothetical protein